MNKYAVVTGSSSGLGAAIAKKLVASGWEVAGISRSPSRVEGDNFSSITLDLTDLAAVEAFFEPGFSQRLWEKRPTKVLLVNNAGTLDPVANCHQLKLREMEQAYRLNSLVPIWLMGRFVEECCTSDLTVVNISSGASKNPYAGWTTYCSTKAALEMAGRCLGEEAKSVLVKKFPDRELKVINYAPGVVDTKMQDVVQGSDEEVFPSIGKFRQLKADSKFFKPDDVAANLISLLDNGNMPEYFDYRYRGE